MSRDDSVRRFVPGLPDYGSPISIRHLIHHTSGLRDEWELLWLAGGRDDDPTEEEDLLAIITRQRGLSFPPGTQHVYSNTNYTLLVRHRDASAWAPGTARRSRPEGARGVCGIASSHPRTLSRARGTRGGCS